MAYPEIPIRKIVGLTIRKRDRRGYLREVGGITGWTEWQVVDGRKIIKRFETEGAAVKFATEKAGRKT